MILEKRIERLEQARPAPRHVHVVFVPGCTVDDEAHNQAVERKALEANPPPEGAQLQIIRFVSAKRMEATG